MTAIGRSCLVATSAVLVLILFANATEAEKYETFLAKKVTALLFDADNLFILQKVALYSAQI